MTRAILPWVALIIWPGATPALNSLPAEMDAQYQAGVHAVVGCEGCHWEGPDRIARTKIPSVCGDCHPGPGEDYENSVHWEDGRAHAVCIDCHGNHGILPVALPESRAHRSLVCGTCHIGPRDELYRGPHGEAFDRTGALVCASCHSNHAVQHPTIEIVEPACETCHARDTDAFSFGQTVLEKFTAFRATSALARSAVDSASSAGYDVRKARDTIDPRIHVIEKFAPTAACDWLIAQAQGRLSRATIYDKATGGTTEDGRRTNSQCDLDIETSGVLTFVLRGRISAITRRQDQAMEIAKVLHYAPGDTFAEHFDYLDPAEPAYATEIAVRGQRTDTFLLYLNDGFSGGETSFPRIGLSHTGAKGDALLFRNVDAAGAPDRDTMHAGLPPTSGEKWLFSQWIREFPKA